MSIEATTLLKSCAIEGSLPESAQLYVELQATPLVQDAGSFTGEVLVMGGDEELRRTLFGLNLARCVTIATCGAEIKPNDRLTVLFERFEDVGIRQLILQHRRLKKEGKPAGQPSGNGTAPEPQIVRPEKAPVTSTKGPIPEQERRRLRNRFSNLRSSRLRTGTLGDNPRARLKTILEFEFGEDTTAAAKALGIKEKDVLKPFETKGKLPKDTELVSRLAEYFHSPRGLPSAVFMEE